MDVEPVMMEVCASVRTVLQAASVTPAKLATGTLMSTTPLDVKVGCVCCTTPVLKKGGVQVPPVC